MNFINTAISFMAHEGGTTSVSFSSDGGSLATGGYDSSIRVWDTNGWRETQRLSGPHRGHVAFLPYSDVLICAGLSNDATVYVCNRKTWQVQRTVGGLSNVWCVSPLPGKRQVAFIQPDDTPDDSHWKPIQIWNVDDWSLVARIGIDVEDIYALSYSQNGKQAAVSFGKGLVSVWDVDFTHKIVEFVAHDNATWAAAFSPSGDMLATGGADNVARLWDTTSWNMLHELPHKKLQQALDHKNGVLCAEFSPDARTLVTGGLDGLVTVWNLGEPILGA